MLLDWPRDDHHLGLFWAALEVSDLERATWKQEIGRQHRLIRIPDDQLYIMTPPMS